MKVNLREVLRNSIIFNYKDYVIRLAFHTQAWTFTHSLRIKKGKEEVLYYLNEDLVNRVLERLKVSEEETWIVLRLGSTLSWTRGIPFLEKALSDCDWNEICKSIYYSVTRNSYASKEEKLNVYRAIREGVEKGIIPMNRWVEKLLWRRMLSV